MKVWLNQRLAESLTNTMSAVRLEVGAKLCCEIGRLNPHLALEATTQLLDRWARGLLLCIVLRGSQWRTALVDADEVEALLRTAIETEEVVTFVDPVSLGGCSVDFTPQTAGTVEILLSAWGDHEDMATELDRRLAGSGTFRGN